VSRIKPKSKRPGREKMDKYDREDFLYIIASFVTMVSILGVTVLLWGLTL